MSYWAVLLQIIPKCAFHKFDSCRRDHCFRLPAPPVLFSLPQLMVPENGFRPFSPLGVIPPSTSCATGSGLPSWLMRLALYWRLHDFLNNKSARKTLALSLVRKVAQLTNMAFNAAI